MFAQCSAPQGRGHTSIISHWTTCPRKQQCTVHGVLSLYSCWLYHYVSSEWETRGQRARRVVVQLPCPLRTDSVSNELIVSQRCMLLSMVVYDLSQYGNFPLALLFANSRALFPCGKSKTLLISNYCHRMPVRSCSRQLRFPESTLSTWFLLSSSSHRATEQRCLNRTIKLWQHCTYILHLTRKYAIPRNS